MHLIPVYGQLEDGIERHSSAWTIVERIFNSDLHWNNVPLGEWPVLSKTHILRMFAGWTSCLHPPPASGTRRWVPQVQSVTGTRKKKAEHINSVLSIEGIHIHSQLLCKALLPPASGRQQGRCAWHILINTAPHCLSLHPEGFASYSLISIQPRTKQSS